MSKSKLTEYEIEMTKLAKKGMLVRMDRKFGYIWWIEIDNKITDLDERKLTNNFLENFEYYKRYDQKTYFIYVLKEQVKQEVEM
jgi:hypothetical protein